MTKNINFKRASLGLVAAALATATMLGTGVTPAHAGPVLCSPSPTPAFSVDDGFGFEVEGVATVRVRLTRSACTSVKVHLATENNNPLSALAGIDYIPTSVDVVIPAKATYTDVFLPLKADNLPNEATETFRVRLTSPVGGTILDGVGIVSIYEGEVEPG